jgi:hypothetical protein
MSYILSDRQATKPAATIITLRSSLHNTAPQSGHMHAYSAVASLIAILAAPSDLITITTPPSHQYAGFAGTCSLLSSTINNRHTLRLFACDQFFASATAIANSRNLTPPIFVPTSSAHVINIAAFVAVATIIAQTLASVVTKKLAPLLSPIIAVAALILLAATMHQARLLTVYTGQAGHVGDAVYAILIAARA